MRCPNLSELPPPPDGKTGWPWTEETVQASEFMPDGKEWPKVSIVTPSYNQGHFIEETIRSVLLQGYPDIEYIIIDGGSSDESVEIIRKYEDWITYWVSEPDKGQTTAINKGFQRSSGTIAAWLNSDDLYTPNAVVTVVDYFINIPNVNVIYGDHNRIDEKTSVLLHRKSFAHDLGKLYHHDYIGQPGSFINLEKLKKIGLLDEEFEYIMDYDLWLRFGHEEGILYYVPETLAFFRVYGSTKSMSQRENFRKEIIKLIDKNLINYPNDLFDPNISYNAYSQILENIICLCLSKSSSNDSSYIISNNSGIDMDLEYYRLPLSNILTIICKDQWVPGDKNLLLKSLNEMYRLFNLKYNNYKTSHYYGSKWANLQLLKLSYCLLYRGMRVNSINIYKKMIFLRSPYILNIQAYKYMFIYVLFMDVVFNMIGEKVLLRGRVFEKNI